MDFSVNQLLPIGFYCYGNENVGGECYTFNRFLKLIHTLGSVWHPKLLLSSFPRQTSSNWTINKFLRLIFLKTEKYYFLSRI